MSAMLAARRCSAGRTQLRPKSMQFSHPRPQQYNQNMYNTFPDAPTCCTTEIKQVKRTKTTKSRVKRSCLPFCWPICCRFYCLPTTGSQTAINHPFGVIIIIIKKNAYIGSKPKQPHHRHDQRTLEDQFRVALTQGGGDFVAKCVSENGGV